MSATSIYLLPPAPPVTLIGSSMRDEGVLLSNNNCMSTFVVEGTLGEAATCTVMVDEPLILEVSLLGFAMIELI
jgi:hypothetical protein